MRDGTCALDIDPKGLDGLMTGCVYIMVGWVIILMEGSCGGYINIHGFQHTTSTSFLTLRCSNSSQVILTMPYPIIPVGVVAGKAMIDGGYKT